MLAVFKILSFVVECRLMKYYCTVYNAVSFFKGIVTAVFWTLMILDLVETYCLHLHDRPSLESLLMRFSHLEDD
jgi:hypothetical protein